MYIYTCEPDFESMMTCIYDVWAARHGSSQVRLMLEPIGQQDLFSHYIHVEPDLEKCDKVTRSIQKKISFEAYRHIFLAAMSDAEDRLDAIYRFMRLGFTYGAKSVHMIGEPSAMRLFELSRRTSNEQHAYHEFIRFTMAEPGVYVSHIEPRCDIAALSARHFADRMPSEHWMIIDDKRKFAVVHPKDKDIYITPLSEDDFKRLKRTEQQEDIYTDLWLAFFRSIAIKERDNPACQRNHLPLRYRNHITEFM